MAPYTELASALPRSIGRFSRSTSARLLYRHSLTWKAERQKRQQHNESLNESRETSLI